MVSFPGEQRSIKIKYSSIAIHTVCTDQLKILKMSTLLILIIHLYTKFTLNMGSETLNSRKTLKTFISVQYGLNEYFHFVCNIFERMHRSLLFTFIIRGGV